MLKQWEKYAIYQFILFVFSFCMNEPVAHIEHICLEGHTRSTATQYTLTSRCIRREQFSIWCNTSTSHHIRREHLSVVPKRLQRVVHRTPATVVVVVVTWSLFSSLSRFCDVVVVVFIVVVQNDCKESFTERQQRPQQKLCFDQIDVAFFTNECIYF